jgi:two-component system sensor histidine kinase DesK
LLSAAWLFVLIQPVVDAFRQHRGELWNAGALALIIVFCVGFTAVMVSWSGRPALAKRLLPLLYVLAVVACLVYGGSGWNNLWIFTSGATGLVIPERRNALRGVLVCAVGLVLLSWWHDSFSDYLIALVAVIIVGLATSGLRVQIILTHELTQAREEVARLAANEERLRLARDLHDLTGQSLSTITLKSELAAKHLDRLPESPDRDKARDQMNEVASVSRQTLRDIREAVSGYRRPTLAVEVITARTALEAAGIEVDDDPELTTVSGTIDPDAEGALAWCLREATTNVVRHAGARHCEIRLTRRGGELTLTVTDDGRGIDREPATGSGLHGMSERLAAVGGHLRLAPAPNAQGFRLTATATATATAPAHDHGH